MPFAGIVTDCVSQRARSPHRSQLSVMVTGVSSVVVTDLALGDRRVVDGRDRNRDGGGRGIDGAVVDRKVKLVGAVEIRRRRVGQIGRGAAESVPFEGPVTTLKVSVLRSLSVPDRTIATGVSSAGGH